MSNALTKVGWLEGEVRRLTAERDTAIRAATAASDAAIQAALATAVAAKTELLVLSGIGIRYTVPDHYGFGHDFQVFSTAVEAAREKLAAGHARAFVTIRIEAAVIDGIGEGTDRELLRFEIYKDRIALVPAGQGGLSDEQKAATLALPPQRLLGICR